MWLQFLWYVFCWQTQLFYIHRMVCITSLPQAFTLLKNLSLTLSPVLLSQSFLNRFSHSFLHYHLNVETFHSHCTQCPVTHIQMLLDHVAHTCTCGICYTHTHTWWHSLVKVNDVLCPQARGERGFDQTVWEVTRSWAAYVFIELPGIIYIILVEDWCKILPKCIDTCVTRR